MLFEVQRAQAHRKLRVFLTLGLALFAGLTLLAPLLLRDTRNPDITVIDTEKPALATLPFSFEPNVGQADPAARFVAHAGQSTLLFGQAEVDLDLPASTAGPPSGTDPNVKAELALSRKPAPPIRVQLQFLDSNPSAAITKGDSLPGKVNYLKGKDPAAWRTGVPTYDHITYRDLYPGANLAYAGAGGKLKGTYTLAPGADPSLIRWKYTVPGVDHQIADVAVDTSGNLRISIESALGTQYSALEEHAPVAWQEINGRRVPISVSYTLGDDNTVGFAVGAYDQAIPLTIDPTIIYSTYLGGFYGDGAGSIGLDSVGDIYIGGTTSSSDFPLAGDPYQPVYGGGNYDMFAAKISPDGQTLIYSTFIGGSDWDEGGLAGVDASGIATLGGWSASADFPTTPGAYQPNFAGDEDVVVARLSADGSSLIFGSYWGDEGVDESYGFALDSAGNTYFTGYYIPDRDSWAFVAALSSNGSQQLFRHNLGGSLPGPGDENANTSGGGIVVDAAGNIYVTGYTRAADFPVTTGAYRTSIEAYEDGFVTKLSPLGQSIIYSTYINGGISDYPSAIAIDSSGNAYITGNTSSPDYPVTTGAFATTCGDAYCSFATKLNATGSDLAYSTFLGGPDFHFDTQDIGMAVSVSDQGNAYVSGYTSAPDFPVVNPIQPNLDGAYDGFLVKLNPAGDAADYSTYLGGNGGDSIGGIALDGLGHVYLAGSSSSTDFPMVNPLQSTMHGQGDAVVAVIEEASAVTRTPTPTVTGTPPTSTPTSNPCGGVTAWSTETPMPIAHSNSASAVLDNKLYVVSGASNSPTPVPYTQQFDPATNSWSTKAPYPNGMYLAYQQAAAVDGEIYTVADTYDPGQSFIEMYDPATDAWSRKATLPEELLEGGLAAYTGKIYLVGGEVPGQNPSNHMYEYDPATDTLTPKANMPSGQFEIGAAAIGSTIYVVGGYQYIHYSYDPSSDTWSTIATPLTPSFSSPAVFTFNGELWAIGGYDNYTQRGYPPDQEVQIYNPTNNTWHFGPALNQPRYFSTAAGVLNGRAYVVGGIDLNSNNYPYDYLNSMESIAYAACPTTTPSRTSTPTHVATMVPPSSGTPTGTATQSASSPTPATTSQASATATRTQIAQASTTPTACSLQFSDVPLGSTFYSYIRCLACRGIVNGYTSGCPSSNPCFRPYNPVTRGQLAKIVSNSAGFNETHSSQSFQDVAVGSTFYLFIERLASRSIVEGYPCGGAVVRGPEATPLMPCGPGNLPYFRPNGHVTRGQTSKIVAIAANLPAPPKGQQTFQDVPTGSPFWQWIESLATAGTIGGYPCGGAGEPCVPPDNRPYFRPGNGVTRGQAAKIVSNTFFPECQVP